MWMDNFQGDWSEVDRRDITVVTVSITQPAHWSANDIWRVGGPVAYLDTSCSRRTLWRSPTSFLLVYKTYLSRLATTRIWTVLHYSPVLKQR